jgi:hypothetical protein
MPTCWVLSGIEAPITSAIMNWLQSRGERFEFVTKAGFGVS